MLGFSKQQGYHASDRLQPIDLLSQFLNVHKLLNNGLELVLLRWRENEAHKLVKTDPLILAFQHVLSVKRELKNASSRVTPGVLSLLDLLCDLLELFLYSTEVALKLLEKRHCGGKSFSDLGWLIMSHQSFRFDLGDLVLDPQFLAPKMVQAGFGIVRSVDYQIGESFDYQPEPRFSAYEPQVLVKRTVKKREYIFCMGG